MLSICTQAWIQGGVKGGGGGVITPPEFSKNKIEKSILEHVFSEGGGG